MAKLRRFVALTFAWVGLLVFTFCMFVARLMNTGVTTEVYEEMYRIMGVHKGEGK